MIIIHISLIKVNELSGARIEWISGGRYSRRAIGGTNNLSVDVSPAVGEEGELTAGFFDQV